ncbi:MAG: DUF3798 domain-containing protein [Deltaproteobacteria bacterium]|jgi:hypothetical protein|nr:DUF3798 domain-containing protein [Deltaproteobacteria bacterium]
MEPKPRTFSRLHLVLAVVLAVFAVSLCAYLLTGRPDPGTTPPPEIILRDPSSSVVVLALGPPDLFPEEWRAAERLAGIYGYSREGGSIRVVEIPPDFEDDPERAARLLTDQGADLDVRALVVAPAFRGSLGAFARLKLSRPDILLLASDSREDPGPFSMYSDLTVSPDFVLRPFFLALSAKELGATTALYVATEMDLLSPAAARMRAVLKAASEDLGLRFVEIRAEPGLGEGSPGSSGRAGAWVAERCAGWVAEYGPEVAFHAPSAPLARALLRCAATEGGYFLEAPRPSPYASLPELAGLPPGAPEAESLDSRGFTELLSERARELPFRGRLGVWPVSYGADVTETLGGLAVKAAGGGATVSEQAFGGTLMALNPGGGWLREDLLDAVTSRKVRKHVLVSADVSVLGGQTFSHDERAVPVKYRSVHPAPVPSAPGGPPFLVGILTGDGAQGSDDLLGAREFERLYGKDSDGGMVRLAVYQGDTFEEQMRRGVELLLELAADPLVKVIVVNQALPGTAEGFRMIKEFRQDIVLLAMEVHESPEVIAPAADLSVVSDYIESGYLIVRAAKELGAEGFVHISFPRHMSYDTTRRRHAVMRAAAEDLGIAFHDETAPDPEEKGVGSESARRYIGEVFPSWLERYGRRTAFFSTNDAHNVALVSAVAFEGGLFVQTDVPTPILGYPQAFGLDLGSYGNRWEDFLRDLDLKAREAGAAGRIGTWAYPLGFCESAGGAEFGRRVVMGEARLDDIQALLDSFSEFSRGAAWSGRYLIDGFTGKPLRNFFLVQQDTYILGKGYLGLTEIDVPDKYHVLGTGLGAATADLPLPDDAGEPGGDADPAWKGGGPGRPGGSEGGRPAPEAGD